MSKTRQSTTSWKPGNEPPRGKECAPHPADHAEPVPTGGRKRENDSAGAWASFFKVRDISHR